MRKTIICLLMMIFIAMMACEASAANKFWWASCRTGGGDCLDGIDGNDLTAGDGAIVMMDAGSSTPVKYEYRLYASSTAESDPIVIAPDSNPGTLRWHLVNVFGVSFQSPAVDGLNRIDLAINSSRSPASGHAELYPEGTSTTSRWKMSNQIGSATVEDVVPIIDDTKGNGDTLHVWSADKVFDQLALKAATDQGMYIGTTSVAINRGSAAQSLTGITAIDGSAAKLTTARTINGTSFDGSANISPLQQKCIVIKGPTATDDYPIEKFPYAITIRTNSNCTASNVPYPFCTGNGTGLGGIHVHTVGGTSVTGGLDECTGTLGACTAVTAVDADIVGTAAAEVTDDGTLTNAGIAAGNWIQWHTTSVSGTIMSVSVCFYYTQD